MLSRPAKHTAGHKPDTLEDSGALNYDLFLAYSPAGCTGQSLEMDV